MPATPCAETDVDEGNRLVTAHLYLVSHVVNSLASRYPRHVDRGELWSAGAHGLVDASRRYDASTGIPFARYAAIRIRGAVIDSTRSRDWATRALRRDLRAVAAAGERFADEHGRDADDHELARCLGISSEQLAARRAAAASATLLHLDHVAPHGDGGDSSVADRIEERDPAYLPEELLEQRELVGTVRTAVSLLDETQRIVIERCYFQGELLRDIADELGVTEARVSQIRSEALNAMRAYFRTTFDGVPPVAMSAPGVRRRAAYVATMAAHSDWRSRLEAGTEDAPVPATAGVTAAR